MGTKNADSRELGMNQKLIIIRRRLVSLMTEADSRESLK